MTVKLLSEQYLEFLSLKGGCTGSSESTHVKMPHCLKSHVTAQMSETARSRALIFLVCSITQWTSSKLFNYASGAKYVPALGV